MPRLQREEKKKNQKIGKLSQNQRKSHQLKISKLHQKDTLAVNSELKRVTEARVNITESKRTY